MEESTMYGAQQPQNDFEERFGGAQVQSNESLRVTDSMRENLLSAMKWVKFLAVLGAIGIAFIVLIAFLCFVAGALGAGSSIDSLAIAGGMGFAVGILYLIIAAICVYPIIKAFKMVSNTRLAMRGSQDGFEEAAENFTSIVKYYGIMTIIVLVIYALVLVGACTVGIAAGNL